MDRLRRGEARADRLPAHAHLVGIAGRGMSGLAQMLVQRGVLVTGSERRSTAPPSSGSGASGCGSTPATPRDRCPRGADFLVYGPESAASTPSGSSAARLGIAQEPAARWLGRLMQPRVGLAVAGRRAPRSPRR